MKQLLAILLVFLTLLAPPGAGDISPVLADENITMRVDSFVAVKQSTATARIADAYPITMGLKFEEIQCYRDLGFVSGWYIYDKYQKKIPVIGQYHHGFFQLFKFAPKRHARLMRALHDKTLKLEEFENLQDYLEWFEVIHPWTAPDGLVTAREGSWRSADKRLSITAFEWRGMFEPQNNFQLVIERAARELHRLDLLDAVGQAGEYRVTSGNFACASLMLAVNQIARTAMGWNVLIDFSRTSRRCAGDNSGYFALQLDHNYQVINSKGYVTYLCDKRGNFLDRGYAGDRGQRYTVVEGHHETPDDRRVIGAFFIKDATVSVETPWPDMAP